MLAIFTQSGAQQLTLQPQGATILSVPGQEIANLSLINSFTGVGTGFDTRGVSFRVRRTSNEVGVYALGLGQSIKFYIQAGDFNMYSSPLQINGDGSVYLPNGIKIGGTETAGSIRWTGTDFEGYNGTQWKSFTGSTIQDTGFWQASSVAGQQPSCPVNYAQSVTSSGKACNNGYGEAIYRNSSSGVYNCGSTIGPLLTSIWCVKVR
ncbi:hypothetical protein GCM10028807_36650 [Spirosoma daeguense]